MALKFVNWLNFSSAVVCQRFGWISFPSPVHGCILWARERESTEGIPEMKANENISGGLSSQEGIEACNGILHWEKKKTHHFRQSLFQNEQDLPVLTRMYLSTVERINFFNFIQAALPMPNTVMHASREDPLVLCLISSSSSQSQRMMVPLWT